MQMRANPTPKAPSDLAIEVRKLQDEVTQKDEALNQAALRIKQQEERIVRYEKLLKLYEEAERLSKIQRFCPSSEKSKFQFQFFDEVELELTIDELDQQIEEEEASEQGKKKKPRKKREGFSPDLPRVRIDLTLTDEEKVGAVNTFFSKVKEELDIIPAQAQVIEYWQEKAVFGEEIGENQIV
jgi:transposase